MNETKMCASMRSARADGKWAGSQDCVSRSLERLLDFGELHVVAPQLGGVFDWSCSSATDSGPRGETPDVASCDAGEVGEARGRPALRRCAGLELLTKYQARPASFFAAPSLSMSWSRRFDCRRSSPRRFHSLIQPPSAHAAFFEHPSCAAHQHVELPVVASGA